MINKSTSFLLLATAIISIWSFSGNEKELESIELIKSAPRAPMESAPNDLKKNRQELGVTGQTAPNNLNNQSLSSFREKEVKSIAEKKLRHWLNKNPVEKTMQWINRFSDQELENFAQLSGDFASELLSCKPDPCLNLEREKLLEYLIQTNTNIAEIRNHTNSDLAEQLAKLSQGLASNTQREALNYHLHSFGATESISRVLENNYDIDPYSLGDYIDLAKTTIFSDEYTAEKIDELILSSMHKANASHGLRLVKEITKISNLYEQLKHVQEAYCSIKRKTLDEDTEKNLRRNFYVSLRKWGLGNKEVPDCKS